MQRESRPYKCSVCGHIQSITTNHEGPVLNYCHKCSWKRDFAGADKSHSIPALGGHTYRVFTYDPSVNESNTMKVSKLKELKGKMTPEQKKRALKALKEFAGNLGGTTDIPADGNLLVSENEFTGTGVVSSTAPEVVAKTFDTEADFDSYTNQRRGIQMTSKEVQAIQNFQEARPTEIDRFHVRYETTDDFGNNNTTVIKKLRESGQFCWTAFSKYESAEEEGKPEGTEDKGSLKEQAPEHIPSEPEDSGEDEEVTVNDPIRITKSITFTDETQGADILADFLEKLEI